MTIDERQETCKELYAIERERRLRDQGARVIEDLTRKPQKGVCNDERRIA
jgi:hypothetical protein